MVNLEQRTNKELSKGVFGLTFSPAFAVKKAKSQPKGKIYLRLSPKAPAF
jgi:hypothetical protein